MFDKKYNTDSVMENLNINEIQQQKENYNLLVEANTSFYDEENGHYVKPVFTKTSNGNIKMLIVADINGTKMQLKGGKTVLDKERCPFISETVKNDLLKENRDIIGANNINDIEARISFMDYFVRENNIKDLSKEDKINIIGNKVKELLKSYYDEYLVKKGNSENIDNIKNILTYISNVESFEEIKENYGFFELIDSKIVVINKKNYEKVLVGNDFSFYFSSFFSKILLLENEKITNDKAKELTKNFVKNNMITEKTQSSYNYFLNNVSLTDMILFKDDIFGIPTLNGTFQKGYSISLTLLKNTNEGIVKKEIIVGLKNITEYIKNNKL